MPKAYNFSITYSSYLNAQGLLEEPLPKWADNTQQLVDFYRDMVLIRVFDQKAIALQRTGQLGTYASSLGQEAIGTAISYAMDKNDVFVPYYRDCATQILRGDELVELLQFWSGDERGNDFTIAKQDLPICIPIATQTCHAAGIATAIKLRNEKRIVVCTCGDGATSKGDFLEAINVAGIWHLPIIFVINNNQWAISVPRSLQTAAETIAQKAIGAGIHGEQVDGNDIIAITDAMLTASERARSGKGPSLIEAITYRLCDHTTADDASRYRANDELNAAWKNDPIKRLQSYLHAQNAWNAEKEKQLQQECNSKVLQAINDYANIPPQAPEDLFDYLYAKLPASLQEQRQQLITKYHANKQDQKNE